MGGAAKRLAAHEGRGRVGDADRQQQLALERAFAHGMIAIVGEIDGLVRSHVDAVSTSEDASPQECRKLPATSPNCQPSGSLAQSSAIRYLKSPLPTIALMLRPRTAPRPSRN